MTISTDFGTGFFYGVMVILFLEIAIALTVAIYSLNQTTPRKKRKGAKENV